MMPVDKSELIEALRSLLVGDDVPSVDDVKITIPSDMRNRSRVAYSLSKGSMRRLDRIPSVPSACRRVFAYLAENEVGTTRQVAKGIELDPKTAGNALAALKAAKLVDVYDLPNVVGND
jgi:hypothetical protein